MDQADPPFYPSLSRTNSEMSDVSSLQSTSSQASNDSDRVPSQEDLDNDNWRYLSDFFVMTKTPTNTSTKLCEYKCMLCLPTHRIVKASKTTYDALKNHIKNHHPAKEAEFLALLKQRPNHNKRRRDSDGIVSSPSSKQKSIADWRGLQWGKPGQPVSNKQMDDDIVDCFVECMLPLVVSSVFSVQPDFRSSHELCDLSISISKRVISK
jgi:hypothetical protein